MQKQSDEIRKLILLSPEFYKQLSKKIAVPSKLLDVEKSFLKILSNKNFTTSQKLALYRHLLMIQANSKNKSQPAPIEKVQEKKVEPPAKESTASQTRFIFKKDGATETEPEPLPVSSTPKKVQNPFLDLFEDQNYHETSQFQQLLPDQLPRPSNSSTDKSIQIISDDDTLDLSGDRKEFLQDIRNEFEDPKLNFQDISIKNLDTSKDYAIVRNLHNDDIVTITKPDRKKKTTPKKKLSKLPITPRSSTDSRQSTSKKWATYESQRLKK